MDIKKSIRSKYIVGFIIFSIVGFIFTFCCLEFWSSSLQEGLTFGSILGCTFFSLVALFFDINAIGNLTIVINPLKSDIFKKYGSEKDIQSIVNEIKNNIEYQDKRIIISKSFILPIEDVEGLRACKDILGVHMLVHKTNFVTDSYSIVLTDKFNNESQIKYYTNEKEAIDKALLILASKCKNAKLGYNSETFKYVRENMQDLNTYDPHSEKPIKSQDIFQKTQNQQIFSRETNSKIKYCTECGCKIETSWKFCHECGTQLIKNNNKVEHVCKKTPKFDKWLEENSVNKETGITIGDLTKNIKNNSTDKNND